MRQTLAILAATVSAIATAGCQGPPSDKFDGEYEMVMSCGYFTERTSGHRENFGFNTVSSVRDGKLGLSVERPGFDWRGGGSIDADGNIRIAGTRRQKTLDRSVAFETEGRFRSGRADLIVVVDTISESNCNLHVAKASLDAAVSAVARQEMEKNRADIAAAERSLEAERQRVTAALARATAERELAARDIAAASAERERMTRELATASDERQRISEATLNAKNQTEVEEARRQRAALAVKIAELENRLSAASAARAIDPAVLATMRSERRLALVVGNGNYERIPKLRNPINDARAVSGALRRLGFEVVAVENADYRTMIRAIAEFGNRLSRNSVGLFYYAGHAVQVRGSNYLVPVDADMRSEAEVDYAAVNAGSVLAKFEAARGRVNIALLDACRDNPLPAMTRSATRGLAVVGQSPTGTLIAYATGPNRLAADGDGANGLFTEALLRHIETDDLKIEDLFKRVTDDVERRSNGRQVPWLTSSLKGDFYFKLPR